MPTDVIKNALLDSIEAVEEDIATLTGEITTALSKTSDIDRCIDLADELFVVDVVSNRIHEIIAWLTKE